MACSLLTLPLSLSLSLSPWQKPDVLLILSASGLALPPWWLKLSHHNPGEELPLAYYCQSMAVSHRMKTSLLSFFRLVTIQHAGWLPVHFVLWFRKNIKQTTHAAITTTVKKNRYLQWVCWGFTGSSRSVCPLISEATDTGSADMWAACIHLQYYICTCIMFYIQWVFSPFSKGGSLRPPKLFPK